MVRARTESGEKERRGGLRGLIRDLLFAALIVGIIFAGIFAFTQTYPPLVVVESASMQHADDVSYVGVIDTGDLVFVQAAPTRASVTTWVEGRISGHATYGDFGDVIVFRRPTAPADQTWIIHRAILYLIPNGTDAYDIPDLRGLPTAEWEGVDRGGGPTSSPFGLQQVTIHGLGWQHNLGITFDLLAFAQGPNRGRSGYVTMGDNNAYDACRTRPDPCEPFRPYDPSWIVSQEYVIGRARGEIPWFGLLKLTFDPSSAQCCDGWGDSRAPLNSWTALAIALPLLIASPFLAEAGIWAWGKYGPRLRGRREVEELAPERSAVDPPTPK